MEKICCVIVTFNRLSLLKECIQAVLNQTRSLDKIIIVDNGSSDGTKEYLSNLKGENIQIIYQENLGGAGGFHTGLKAAYEQEYDWIWLMDDDVEVASDCLENLLKYSNISKCLHPNKYYIDNVNFKWEQWYDPFRGVTCSLHNTSFKNNKDICFVNVGCFEGMLISREIVNKIGFPNKNYFIVGDDLEYGFLASNYTNVSYVKNAKIIRKKKSYEELPSLNAMYYSIRNRHLMKNIPNIANLNFNTNYVYELYTFKTYIGFMRYIIRSEKNINNKFKKLKIITKGYKDYFFKVVGKMS